MVIIISYLIENIICKRYFNNTISHGEKEADIASVKSEFWKNKQGECMKRMHRVLSSFSRGSKNARLNQLMFRNLKTVETVDGFSETTICVFPETRKDMHTGE